MSPGEATILVGLGGIAVALFLALMLFNRHHRLRDARAEGLRRELAPLLARWAERGATAEELEWPARLADGDARTVLLLAVAALSDLPVEAAARVRHALHRAGLVRREVSRLGARAALARAEACRIVGRIGDRSLTPLLLARLRDPDAAVRREAIRALGDLGAVEALPEMVAAIARLGEWDNLILLMALVRTGPEAAAGIAALIRTASSPAMTKALLQVTGRLGVAADPGLVRELARHPDTEVRVEAVRVLGTIAPDPDAAAVCLAAMDDPEWPVRALAAWSLGRVGDDRAIARLARAMGDPAYWVRHHVAEALAALGERGEATLRRGLQDDNPFVRDMAAQTLFMRALAEGEAA